MNRTHPTLSWTLATGLALCLSGIAFPDSGPAHRTQQPAPISLGTSGINPLAGCAAATLGSQIKVGDVKYILSNNHVLARENAAALGEGIIHRSPLDAVPVCTQPGTSTVANLSGFIPIVFGGVVANTVDAAIAAVVAGQVSSTGNILDIGVPSTTTVSPSVGMKVKKSGRTTGLTSGSITSVGVSVLVGYSSGTALFVSQFLIGPGSFSAPGDSGSLVTNKPKKGPSKPVGLLFAGSSLVTVANNINTVLASFGAGFVASSAPDDGEGPPPSVRDFIPTATRIKDSYSRELFALPDVVGHGVGVSSRNPNDVVIQLLVRSATPRALAAAPSTVGGVKVEVLEVGEIRALPLLAHSNK